MSLLTAACGSLDGRADSPGTLATVGGSITNPNALQVQGNAFRVAVVWDTSGQALGDGGYANDRRTTQDIAVTPIFPAQFQVQLAELPSSLQPFQELFGAPPDVDLRGVGGFIVAYEDSNHNGKLDLVTASSPGFVDRVLGEAPVALLYLEGKMPSDPNELANGKDASGHLPALGFNVFETYCVSGKAPPPGRSCNTFFDWVPVSTPISIALTGDANLANIMCQELPSSATREDTTKHTPGELPATFPSATDPNVQCAADGRSYTFTVDRTDTPPGICQPSVTYHNQDTYSLAPGVAAPSGWPCTAR